jgi:hypothetical protein
MKNMLLKMRRRFVRLAIKISCLLFVAATFSRCKKDIIVVAPGERVEIPLKMYYRQGVKPTVMININGYEREVIFDTGSFGLRIIRGAVAEDELSLATALSYSYGTTKSDTLLIRGKLAGGYFSIGSNTGTTSVRFMVVDSTSVNRGSLTLKELDKNATSSSVFDDFSGILGVGLRYDNGLAANPLVQLPGNGKYIVKFPRYGDKKGVVLLNPSDSDLTGFTTMQLQKDGTLLPNGYYGWQDNRLNGFISFDGTSVMAPTDLDTGSPSIYVASNKFPSGDVKKGNVNYGLTDVNANKLIESSFLISKGIPGIDLIKAYQGKNERIIFGTQFFFAYDVLYDQKNGQVGIRKKS